MPRISRSGYFEQHITSKFRDNHLCHSEVPFAELASPGKKWEADQLKFTLSVTQVSVKFAITFYYVLSREPYVKF